MSDRQPTLRPEPPADRDTADPRGGPPAATAPAVVTRRKVQRDDGTCDDRRFIKFAGVCNRLEIGVSTGERMRAAGRIGPRAVRCGGLRYWLPEVLAWLATPAPTGELYDATTWPAVWAAINGEKK